MTDLDTFITAWADAERGADAATTERLLTDDFVGIGPVGFELPKSAWLQRLAGGDLHYDELSLDEVTTRRYGDCAVTTARWNARGTAQGHPIPEAARLTLISVQQDAEWRLAGVHFSFIAGTPGAPGGPVAS
jgi:ketosteroid isomerase-like protein